MVGEVKKEGNQETLLQEISSAEKGKVGFFHRKKEKTKSLSRKKKKKWLKPVIIIVIIALVIGFIFLKAQNSNGGYTQVTAELRDIVTYHSFTGTIEPVEDEDVMPSQAGLMVQEIDVEEGDAVQTGDVLMQLDTTDLEEEVKELQATMTADSNNNAMAIAIAQQNYDDYKTNLDEEQNESIIAAQQSMDTAYASLVSAQQSFNNEVELNNDGLSSTMLTAISNVDSAYSSVNTAKTEDDATDTDVSQASLDAAWVSYNSAVEAFEAAKSNEENSLTELYDSLIQSQTAYLDTLDSYNATVTEADQQLASYALQLEQAQTQADDSVNQLKLADLQRQIADCTLTAPMDGYVTSLPANEGDVTISGTSLATITNFDKMKIEIKINEYDILGVEEGNQVDIDVDALDKTYTGTITKIAKVATIDSGVSYFDSEVDFDADDDTRSGMSVEVRLTTNDLKQVLTVPTDAVLTQDDGTAYVEMYGTDGKSIVKQAVSCGVSDGTYTQITDGLKEGDIVLESTTKTDDSTSTYDNQNSDMSY